MRYPVDALADARHPVEDGRRPGEVDAREVRAREHLGSGSEGRRPGAREPAPRGRPLHRVDRRLPRDVATSATHRPVPHYPRLVGETGGKDFVFAHESADVDALAVALVRGAFEFQGQKCSAASRAYIPSTLAAAGEGPHRRHDGRDQGGRRRATSRNFMGAVIDRGAFRDITRFIEHAEAGPAAKSSRAATCDDKDGFFVQPTLIETPDPKSKLMREEIFGPVLTLYVYDARSRRGARRSATRPRPTPSPAPSSPGSRVHRATPSRAALTPRATSTSTTSRPAPWSVSSRSAARAPRARTTRRARSGT